MLKVVLIAAMTIFLMNKNTWLIGVLLLIYIVNYFKKEQDLEEVE